MTISAEEAKQLQTTLAPSVVRTPPPDFAPTTATGLDVTYTTGSAKLAAAVVTVDVASGAVLETAVGEADFPYVPRCSRSGNCRSCSPHRPNCRRRPTCWWPTIGVAKQPLGSYDPPGPARGDTSPMPHDGEVVGAVLRTQPDVKPVFVSVGHLIDLPTACEYVLTMAPRFRLPETTRQADHLSRATLRAHVVAAAQKSFTGHGG